MLLHQQAVEHERGYFGIGDFRERSASKLTGSDANSLPVQGIRLKSDAGIVMLLVTSNGLKEKEMPQYLVTDGVGFCRGDMVDLIQLVSNGVVFCLEDMETLITMVKTDVVPYIEDKEDLLRLAAFGDHKSRLSTDDNGKSQSFAVKMGNLSLESKKKERPKSREAGDLNAVPNDLTDGAAESLRLNSASGSGSDLSNSSGEEYLGAFLSPQSLLKDKLKHGATVLGKIIPAPGSGLYSPLFLSAAAALPTENTENELGSTSGNPHLEIWVPVGGLVVAVVLTLVATFVPRLAIPITGVTMFPLALTSMIITQDPTTSKELIWTVRGLTADMALHHGVVQYYQKRMSYNDILGGGLVFSAIVVISAQMSSGNDPWRFTVAALVASVFLTAFNAQLRRDGKTSVGQLGNGLPVVGETAIGAVAEDV